MRQSLVSIVAPVYNIERYLSPFIDSVLRQTFTEWELLLVDDGSSDSSGRICDDYARKDKRISVIHKINGGVSSARNAGLKQIKGDWVLMPDPDDELPLDSLETLMSSVSDEIDLLSASYVWYKNGKLKIPSSKSIDMDLTREDYVSLMGVIPQPRNLDRRCCNKLFRASIIRDNDVFFPEDVYYREDILYNYLFINAVERKIRCISYDMYIYYMRDTGAAITLQDSYSRKSGGKFIAMTRCYDILEQMGSSNLTKARMKSEILNAYIAINRLIIKTGVGGRDRIVFFKKLRQYFSTWELLLIGIKGLFRHVKKGWICR